jgi:hypothetical protein
MRRGQRERSAAHDDSEPDDQPPPGPFALTPSEGRASSLDRARWPPIGGPGRGAACGVLLTAVPDRYGHQAVTCADEAGLTAMQTRQINRPQERKSDMSKVFQYGGILASIVLIAFGAGSVITGINGRDRVHNDLAREQIVGTPDSSIPNQLVNNGTKAEAFAKTMRKHTLEATGGQTYAQMGRYMGKDGKATNDEKLAAVDPKSGKRVDNPLRNLWVTETALTTALHSSYFAESVATFAIVMGFALMLTGGGFLVLTLRVLRVFGKEETDTEPAVASGGVAVTS